MEYTKLLSAISEMNVIDTHEHLPHDKNAVSRSEKDILYSMFRQYLSSDMLSSGMSAQDMAFVRDASLPVLDRWRVAEPYYALCRYTGYGRATARGIKELYGYDAVTSENIEDIAKKHRAAYEGDRLYEILSERLHIERAVLDGFTGTAFDFDERLFRRVERYDGYMGVYEIPFETLGSFDDWIAYSESELDKSRDAICGYKIGLAYNRSLCFPKPSYAQAKSAFDEAMTKRRNSGDRSPTTFPETTQNYMLHRLLETNRKYRLPVQIHTGLQEGNGNILSNSDPMKLESVFLAYPEVPFDIFHIGWPFQRRAIALAKMFPNVTLDFCWANIISPTASVEAFREALDAVPYNKIMAFGGDYCVAEGVVGHLLLARENLARALQAKIDLGEMNYAQAESVAHATLYENPKRVFFSR